MKHNGESAISYLGGSPEAEQQIITKLGKDVHQEILNIAKKNRRAPVRPQHTKMLGSITNAQFRIADDIPGDLQQGFLQPGVTHPAIVRFSNAAAYMAGDTGNDLRGAAISVLPDSGSRHDWLMTNAEAHHARNAVQALATSVAFCFPGKWNKIRGLLRLVGRFGFRETKRILKTVGGQSKIPVESITTETFFSRAPVRIGSVVIKYRLAPEEPKSRSPFGAADLAADLRTKLMQKDIRFFLQAQRFEDAESTPIEDNSVLWRSPYVTIAELILPMQAMGNDEDFFTSHHFNPWNVNSDAFEPVGNMNRARRVVYASAVKTQQQQ